MSRSTTYPHRYAGHKMLLAGQAAFKVERSVLTVGEELAFIDAPEVHVFDEDEDVYTLEAEYAEEDDDDLMDYAFAMLDAADDAADFFDAECGWGAPTALVWSDWADNSHYEHEDDL